MHPSFPTLQWFLVKLKKNQEALTWLMRCCVTWPFDLSAISFPTIHLSAAGHLAVHQTYQVQLLCLLLFLLPKCLFSYMMIACLLSNLSTKVSLSEYPSLSILVKVHTHSFYLSSSHSGIRSTLFTLYTSICTSLIQVERKPLENRSFICFVFCCIFSTWNSA